MGSRIEQITGTTEESKAYTKWKSLRYNGAIWDAYDDPQDIADTAFSNVQNISYDKSYPSPRKGSILKWNKPDAETTASALCLFNGRDSDGINYAIGVYAPNFYLRDETNNMWVKLNSSYTPSSTYTSLMYGYTNWDAGISSDVLYAGNGTETSIKWQIGTAYVSVLTTAGSTSLPLADASKIPATSPESAAVTVTIATPAVFTQNNHGLIAGDRIWLSTTGALPTGLSPMTVYYVISAGLTTNAFEVSATLGGSAINTSGGQSGTHTLLRDVLIIKSLGGSEIYTTYSVGASNTLTVPALPSDVAAGSIVTFQIRKALNVPKGKIFNKYQGRLIVASGLAHENTVYGSMTSSPESFNPDTPANAPFSQIAIDGFGGITGIDNFGDYLLIEKDDTLTRLDIQTSTGTDGSSYKTVDFVPVASGLAIGPVQPWARIKQNNVLYFATASEGIFEADPTVTGSQTSVTINILSQIIKPYVEQLSFVNSRTAVFNQKLLWTATNNSMGDTVLVYDLLRQNWSKFTGWNVKDWIVYNNLLYFVSRVDGNIYQAFADTKLDGSNPFDAYIYSKKFDFGDGALPKTTSVMFASGYISPQENLYFDVILTIGNDIKTFTYEVQGNGKLTVTSIPKALAMAMLGIFTYGQVEIDPATGQFRVYLAIPMRYGWYTLQIKVYSTVNGTDWGLTGFGFAPLTELKHPANMEIGVISDPTNAQNNKNLKVILDSYSETNKTDDFPLSTGYYLAAGQSFSNEKNATLSLANLFLSKIGTPTGNVTAQIYAISGVFGGNGIPTGTALATSDPVDATNLSTTYQLTSFFFTGANAITLQGGTNYFLVINYTGGDISNIVNIGINQPTPTADGNFAFYSLGNWTSFGQTFAACFYVYGVLQ